MGWIAERVILSVAMRSDFYSRHLPSINRYVVRKLTNTKVKLMFGSDR